MEGEVIIIRKDLTNKQFGYLRVLRFDEDRSDSKHKFWICECKCKRQKSISYSALTSKIHPTRSCGENDCIYHKMLRSESRKLKNTYNLSGEYGIGYTSKGEEFWFDLEDYDKVNNYCWYKDEMGYVRTNTYNYENNSRSYLFLHNLIMNIKPNMDVIPDHIGGIDTIHDNRQLNLRLSDRSNNNMNT